MFYLVYPVAATETKVVVDEKGSSKSEQVSKKAYRSQLVGYF
jgi:hypothetical protein